MKSSKMMHSMQDELNEMKHDCIHTTWLISSVRFFILGRCQQFFQEGCLSAGSGLLDDLVFETALPFSQEPGSCLGSKHQQEVLQNLIKKGRLQLQSLKVNQGFLRNVSNTHFFAYQSLHVQETWKHLKYIC